jgi:hypothetical protein
LTKNNDSTLSSPINTDEINEFILHSQLYIDSSFSIVDNTPLLQLYDFTKKWEELLQQGYINNKKHILSTVNEIYKTVILRPDGHVAAILDIPLAYNDIEKTKFKLSIIDELAKKCLCL